MGGGSNWVKDRCDDDQLGELRCYCTDLELIHTERGTREANLFLRRDDGDKRGCFKSSIFQLGVSWSMRKQNLAHLTTGSRVTDAEELITGGLGGGLMGRRGPSLESNVVLQYSRHGVGDGLPSRPSCRLRGTFISAPNVSEFDDASRTGLLDA